MRTDEEIRRNAPVVLFEIVGQEYLVSLLPMNAADAWLETAENIAGMEPELRQLMATGKREEYLKLRREFNKSMLEAVLAYSKTLQVQPVGRRKQRRDATEEDIAQARERLTAPQVVGAFQVLRDMTDPFAQMQKAQMQELKEVIKGLPEEAVNKVLSKVFDTQSSRGLSISPEPRANQSGELESPGPMSS